MELDAYLRDEDISQAEFARRIGISDTYLSRILTGERGASLKVAHRIEQATAGSVTLADLLHMRELRKAS